MSNITLFTSGALAVPDYLQQVDETTRMLAGSGGKSISIKGGVWRMMIGSEEVARNEDRQLNMIVLTASKSVQRTYYEGAYDENVVASPACWSADGVRPNEEVPAETKQCNTCAQCPQNIAGSGQGDSRACRYSRRLGVVLENDITGNIYRLQLPAKSIFGKADGDKMPLDAYAKFLSGHNVPITGVVTEARFDTSEAVPVIKFRAVRPLTREEWEAARAQSETADALGAIELKITPSKPKEEAPNQSYQAPAPAAPAAAPVASKPKTTKPKPAPAPAPVAEPQEESAPEPVVRAAKPPAAAAPVAAAPAANSRIESVLSDWMDDDDDA
jgi:hypothetical protein